MPEIEICGVPVNFPFAPYDVQQTYMTKVIECLENGTNAVLESPTGTGKTLSLLCSTLAWVLKKKAEISLQSQAVSGNIEVAENSIESEILAKINKASMSKHNWSSAPRVIYASRTHSQLTQAMQELKRTSYSFMRAVVLGSRDQLCIHPEVSKEINNANKIQMCKIRVTTHTCHFYNRVEKCKGSPELRQTPVMDIEDLVTVGRKLSMCPYFGAKELIQEADIVFMPYNYLLDPKTQQANKIDLNNTIIILDEAHNVEKMCEESASIQIRSSDIAVAIEDVTHVMRLLADDASLASSEEGKDFSLDDLAILKEMFLELEKAIDEIKVPMKFEGVTHPGGFMFELLQKANINSANQAMIIRLLDNLIQFLSLQGTQEKSIFRRGGGLQILSDLLTIVFVGKDEDREKVLKCFKVHIEVEGQKQSKSSTKKDGWITPKAVVTKSTPKVINYWCFNPGFGMEHLLGKNVRSIILTSGTLAPLKPLIAELGIPISVRLENPHIISKSQVCVKTVPFGPDKEGLNSNYKNRDNPKYVSSLGRTILSFCPVIPDGLLVFFPSYPFMNNCIDSWQASGIWSQISKHKPIFVEPRTKDAFKTTMEEFYAKINDPNTKGACFMAVCRGKVSEGLDFVDANGRAVIITGLPYPPLKDPRVILKKKYLEENRTKENELLSGDSWYALEATRAVNQAIGRIIRHKNDYGAILLCDSRFNYSNQKSQLSAWIQEHLRNSQQYTTFGPLIGEVSRFFRNAERTLPKPCLRELQPPDGTCNEMDQRATSAQAFIKPRSNFKMEYERPIKIEKANSITSWSPADYFSAAGSTSGKAPSAADFMSRLDGNVSAIDFNEQENGKISEDNYNDGLVTIQKRERSTLNSNCLEKFARRKRLKLVSNTSFVCGSDIQPVESGNSSQSATSCSYNTNASEQQDELPTNRAEVLKLIKDSISSDAYNVFVKALLAYKKEDKFEDLLSALLIVFGAPCFHYLFRGMRRFIKEAHKSKFDEYVTKHLS